MTLEREDKKALSGIRMEKAREFLEDARANFKESRHRTAVNRSYYAALNAARALLILEGANPETHDGVVTMLSLRFVKPGLLSTKAIKDFKILLSRRTDVDYGDFEKTDAVDTEDSLKIAEAFIQEVDDVRKGMIEGL